MSRLSSFLHSGLVNFVEVFIYLKAEKIFLYLFFLCLSCLLLLFRTFLRFTRKTVHKSIFLAKTGGRNSFIVCPVRGVLGTKVYDSIGNFSEEYYRVKIIKQLLSAGFPQQSMCFHHKIQIGHKGKNSFIPDLVIQGRSGKNCFLVMEVKKNSSKMEEALLYQLNPAMRILNARYAIYYDGSSKSACFRADGSKVLNFNFSRIGSWFFNE